jgi:DNA primase
MSSLIPKEIIDEIRDRCDITEVVGSYLTLSRRGTDFWGCCPFHKEKTPSFKVSSDRQAYYCFGCQKSGNVFDFVMELENLDFVGAVKLLANRVNVLIPERTPQRRPGDRSPEDRFSKERLREVLGAYASWYQQQLHAPAGEVARRYLLQRQLPPEVVGQFCLGYSPDSWDAALTWGQQHGYDQKTLAAAGLVIEKDENGRKRCYDRFRGRLMFPIWDELGRVVGFSARILDSEAKSAKYINTPETKVFHKGRLLYGLHFARKSFKDAGTALICEGQLDVIACHRAGVTHAVAPQGTAFTETHATLLKRYTDNVTFAFDADTAGQKAAARSIQVVLGASLTPRVVSLPEGQDPDGVLRSAGAEALKQQMDQRQDAFDFLFDRAAGTHDLQNPEGQAAIAQEILPALQQIKDPIARAARCQWLANRLNLPEAAISESLNQLIEKEKLRSQPRPGGQPSAAPQGPSHAPPRRHQGSSPQTPPSNVEPHHEMPDFDYCDEMLDLGYEHEILTIPGQQSVPAAPPTPAGPATSPNIQNAEKALLDLALHYERVARSLIESLPAEEISPSPVGQALNQVLALTAQGEWSLSAAELEADAALAGQPAIARLLVTSDFSVLDPAQEEDEEKRKRLEDRLDLAMSDCLRQLKCEQIKEELAGLNQSLETESDRTKLKELFQRCHELEMRRRQLQPGNA